MKLIMAYQHPALLEPVCEVVKRGRLYSSAFNVEKFLSAEVEESVKDILLSLPRPTTDEEISKISTILSLSARRDIYDPNKKLGWRSNEALCSLSTETLEILAMSLNIFTQEGLNEVISLLVTGVLPEELLREFIDSMILKNRINKPSFYEYFLDKIGIDNIEESFMDFLENDILLHYYPMYSSLKHLFRIEFWKWIWLKERGVLKNPAARFFEKLIEFEGIRDDNPRFRVLEELRKERRRIVAISKGLNAKMGALSRDYNWQEEIANLTREIQNFPKGFQPNRDGESNIHHLFFPSNRYTHGIIKAYRGKAFNKIRILKKSHARMNIELENFGDRYGFPILTPDLIDAIKAYRENFEIPYLNFLSLRRTFAEICSATEPSIEDIQNDQVREIYALSARFYDLFEVQAKYINRETVR